MAAMGNKAYVHLLVYMLATSAAVKAIVKLSSRGHQSVNRQAVASFDCDAGVSITKCQFKILSDTDDTETPLFDSIDIRRGWSKGVTKTFSAKSEHTNLATGMCDFSVKGLPQGRYLFGCRGRTVSVGWIYSYTTLSVSTDQVAPTEPSLDVKRTLNNAIDMLEATCTVSESRPPANITWYFGDEVLDDVMEVDVDDKWRWSWDSVGRTQTVRRNLTSKDNEKELTCSVTHEGLTEPLNKSETIYVEGADGSVMYAIIGGVSLILGVVAILVIARLKRCWCFAVPTNITSQEGDVTFSKSPQQPTSTTGQSEPDAVYAQVLPRDQRHAAERAQAPDHVVYAEIVPTEPPRKPARMVPQQPEVQYTEVAFKKK